MAGLDQQRVEIERDLALLQRQVREVGRPLTHEENAVVSQRAGEIRQRLANYMTQKLIEERPEVISRGAPVSGDAAQHGLEEARARLSGCVSCPAAQEIHPVDGSIGCRCQIEGSILTSKTDPQSLLTFCVGTRPDAYESCPTWMAARDAELAGRPLEGVV